MNEKPIQWIRCHKSLEYRDPDDCRRLCPSRINCKTYQDHMTNKQQKGKRS